MDSIPDPVYWNTLTSADGPRWLPVLSIVYRKRAFNKRDSFFPPQVLLKHELHSLAHSAHQTDEWFQKETV